MTQSQIFTAAHKLAKTFEGDYSACLALALRETYEDMKKQDKDEPRVILLSIPYLEKKERAHAKKYLNAKWDPETKLWSVFSTMAEVEKYCLTCWVVTEATKEATTKENNRIDSGMGFIMKNTARNKRLVSQYGFDAIEMCD